MMKMKKVSFSGNPVTEADVKCAVWSDGVFRCGITCRTGYEIIKSNILIEVR